ncbi:hypothetical protein Vretimale_2835 [Volvox reticuliferus]|uniref:Large ribosomal subunit protein uL23c n=1 Tax=Volvox reticuliferus TaxID=1737510 RepID=A0A8J4C4F7_9CHLO|nr:hypothetical protein Vretifemale_1835 [Volvox reticuliferus]GIL97089.1 hypothetical protein Vretimale_2835 [Volvox reticuliferus]
MAHPIRIWQLLLNKGCGCLPHTQLGRSGTLEILSTSAGLRSQHTAGNLASLSGTASEASQAAKGANDSVKSSSKASNHRKQLEEEPDDLDEPPLPPLRFVSREQRTVRRMPPRRIPICFPNITLQMLKLRDKQLAQLRETGWLREVAFRTTPEVTKLEIAAFLESVYGMSVERVHTINYLGRARLDAPPGKNKRHFYRDDDWKKAYVVFRPPPGMGHLLAQQQQEGGAEGAGSVEDERPVLEQIREAARAPRPEPRPLPWRRRPPR